MCSRHYEGHSGEWDLVRMAEDGKSFQLSEQITLTIAQASSVFDEGLCSFIIDQATDGH